MFKLITLCLLGFLLKGVLFAGLPASVTVLKDTGITLRSDIESGNEILGQVHHHYRYNVVAGKVSYYKIQLEDSKEGWIYANVDKNWTEAARDKVVVLFEDGLNVRQEPYSTESPIVGYVKQGESYTVLDQVYSYLKVDVPGNIQGWIYAGKPTDPWVNYHQTSIASPVVDTRPSFQRADCPEPSNKSVPTQVDTQSFLMNTQSNSESQYFISFIGGDAKGDFDVKSSGVDGNRDNQFNSFRLFNPGSSFLELNVNLSSLDHTNLILEHNIDTDVTSDDDVAYISMSVNDRLVVRGMSVSSDEFREFTLSLKNFLRKGSNTIRIDLLRGSKKDYWLRSVALR